MDLLWHCAVNSCVNFLMNFQWISYEFRVNISVRFSSTLLPLDATLFSTRNPFGIHAPCFSEIHLCLHFADLLAIYLQNHSEFPGALRYAGRAPDRMCNMRNSRLELSTMILLPSESLSIAITNHISHKTQKNRKQNLPLSESDRGRILLSIFWPSAGRSNAWESWIS